ILFVAICRFAEPIVLTSVNPYLPEMIESFGVPQNEVAKWAGIASAIFSLCQCLTSIPWGRLSDTIGRKPVILVGLFNTMVTSLIWGFSSSLPMALTSSRALAGAGNGNIGIIRTMVAELCPWKELQPRAFSIMPLVYNIGSVIGPSIGGALANPMRVKPGSSGNGSFLERYPYALPNLVTSAMFFIGITTGILFLHETLASRRNRLDYGLRLGRRLIAVTREQYRRGSALLYGIKDRETEPLIKSLASSEDVIVPDEGSSDLDLQIDKSGSKYADVFTKQSVLNLIVYTILALHALGYDQLLPVFMHHHPQSTGDPNFSPPLKFAGGFGIDSARIGVLFTLYGFSGIFFQLVVFPPVARRYGVLNCLRVVLIVFPILYLLTPFTTLMPTATGKQATLVILMLIKGVCSTFAFPGITIILTNSASSLQVLGTLNGVATSVSAIGRAAGPAIGGSIFTLGVKHGFVLAPFWVFAAIALLGALSSFLLVEGEGFGDDKVDEDTFEDIEDNPYVKAAPLGIQGQEMIDESESEYGDIGPLLSRSATNMSEAVESVDGSDIEGSNSRSTSRRGSRVRRRSSVPLGMNAGFKRYSSNLGQT
ncbi:MFS general substrate transporter, partial [Patellaria atrata CBS 101060]